MGVKGSMRRTLENLILAWVKIFLDSYKFAKDMFEIRICTVYLKFITLITRKSRGGYLGF